MDPSPSRKTRGLPFSRVSERGLGRLALAIAVLMLGAALAWHAYRVETRSDEGSASRLAEAVAEDVGRGVEQLDLMLRTVMGGEQTPANLSLTPSQRDALLLERTPRDRFIAFLEILDAQGNVLAKLNQDEPASNWSNQDYFIALRDNPTNDVFVGAPFSTDNEAKVGFKLARRISTSDGKFAGVVVVGFRLAAFREMLGRHELTTAGSVTLLRDDGIVLMRVPFDLKDIGHLIEPVVPFRAFARSASPPFLATDDHIETRFIFRKVGTYRLVVAVAQPTEDGSASSYPYWLAAGVLAIGAGFWLLIRRLWQERSRRQAAERQSQEKSQFLTMLSHELRTPLQGVLGYADQLSSEHGLTPAQTRQILEIVRAARQMREVVNIVLDYARVEALGPALHMRRFNIRQLAQDCLAVIEPSARVRGLEMRCIELGSVPDHFVTDDIQLRQILSNLLSNAVKYTPSGWIELRLRGDEQHLVLEVADTGIGIPESRRHHLFEEFERFGAERTSIEGTGLGLAIARRLARRLGGHIGHRANPGGGSIFWVELPAGTADEPFAKPELQDLVVQRGLSVLVVDDSEVNREVAAAFLRKAGHAVTEARDGDEAVRLAGAKDFDVVVMDLRMGTMDGLEATRHIRSLNRASLLPIL
jgi:signal transduction histidine kinase